MFMVAHTDFENIFMINDSLYTIGVRIITRYNVELGLTAIVVNSYKPFYPQTNLKNHNNNCLFPSATV